MDAEVPKAGLRPLHVAVDVTSSTLELIADVYLYPTDEGGKKFQIQDVYRCPCFVQKDTKTGGWDCMVQVGRPPLSPGQRRQMGFIFLSGHEAVRALTIAKRFYLWDGRFVGEADVVTPKNSK